MPGFTEILIIIAIILAIFVLPKRLGKKSRPVRRPLTQSLKSAGWKPVAILFSILWLALFAFYLKPWENGWQIFFYAGPGPVVLFWGFLWIFHGFKKKRS